MFMQTETYAHLGHWHGFILTDISLEYQDAKISWGNYGNENCIVPMSFSLSFIYISHKRPSILD